MNESTNVVSFEIKEFDQNEILMADSGSCGYNGCNDAGGGSGDGSGCSTTGCDGKE